MLTKIPVSISINHWGIYIYIYIYICLNIYIYICLNELMKLKWNHVINMSQNKNAYGNATCSISTIFAWDNCLKPSTITFFTSYIEMISTFPLSRVKPVHASLESSSDEDTPSKSGSSTLPQLRQHPRRSWEFRHFDNNSLNNNNKQQQQQRESPRTPVGSGMGSYPSTPMVSRRDHTLTRRMLEGNFINSLN